MLSLLPDRRGVTYGFGMLVLGMAALIPASLAAQPTLEPIAPSRVVVHGPETHFDLIDLGPDFSEAWLEALLPVSTPPDDAPALTRRVALVADGDDWVPRTRTTYERTENGQPVARHIERWDSTAWKEVTRTTYRYRDEVLVGQRTEVWIDGAWQPDHDLAFARDTDGHIREVVHHTRRGERWKKTARLTISPPDTSHRRLVRETWSDGAWKPHTRVTFTVAEEGRHIVQRNETWTGTEWEASVRLAFMYDGAGYPIEKSVEVWTGATWAEGPLQLYDYDLDGARIEQRTETWIGTNRIRTERTELTYATPLRTWLLSTAPSSD